MFQLMMDFKRQKDICFAPCFKCINGEFFIQLNLSFRLLVLF
jgi:hypothetical protein